ncbi:HDOD domain protein [Marinomonas spartinae]|uniref:HDOD domain-containing protein n=1 Tax=Marinomonas spartinae TaxID=1792290 RepID=UPI00080910C9|nr:HDOD domain-containing protein [Marinomonas spartinae]SBS35148.1 HDOD domain protein [Marinomonas spartinae]
MQISTLLKQTDKLPNVPDVVLELIEALKNPDVHFSVIAEKVAHDQTISLKVLRAVNSAYFGLSRKVYSIDEAIAILGTNKLKTMVIASGFVNSVESVQGLDLKGFWYDSFAVAELAQWLGKRTSLVDDDEAFTAGIVHNIGRLLLHLAESGLAISIQEQIRQGKGSRFRIETEALGFTTQDAGKALLDLWKFPPELGEAVKHHKRPFAEQQPPQPLACILNLACYFNACIRNEREMETVHEGLPLAVVKAAGITPLTLDDVDQALNLDNELSYIMY